MKYLEQHLNPDKVEELYLAEQAADKAELILEEAECAWVKAQEDADQAAAKAKALERLAEEAVQEVKIAGWNLEEARESSECHGNEAFDEAVAEAEAKKEAKGEDYDIDDFEEIGLEALEAAVEEHAEEIAAAEQAIEDAEEAVEETKAAAIQAKEAAVEAAKTAYKFQVALEKAEAEVEETAEAAKRAAEALGLFEKEDDEIIEED